MLSVRNNYFFDTLMGNMNTTKQQIEIDLKQAMLAGNKTLVTTLRGLKSAILYAEVASGDRDAGMDEQAVIMLLQKEAKKRQESAELYAKGGSDDRRDAELAEKKIIEKYLPTQLSEAEITGIVEEVIKNINASSIQQMGQVMSAVKGCLGPMADGSVVARIVKERLSQ